MPLKKANNGSSVPAKPEPDLKNVPFIQTQVDDGFGEMTAASYEMPRMKLLHPVSPEVIGGVEGAKAGVFWHGALNESLGNNVKVVVVRQTPYYGLLDPSKGNTLAKASMQGEWLDGAANSEFRVEIGRRPVDWKTKANLAQSGLAVMGSSGGYWAAATPCFDVVLWLEEESMPVMMTFKKTAARPLRELFTILDMRKNSGVPRHAQSFFLKSRLVQGKETSYYVPYFENAGIIRDEKHIADLQALAKQLSGIEIKVVGDEAEEVARPGGDVSYDNRDERPF